MLDHSFSAFRVSETSENKFESTIVSRTIEDLPDNDVFHAELLGIHTQHPPYEPVTTILNDEINSCSSKTW